MHIVKLPSGKYVNLSRMAAAERTEKPNYRKPLNKESGRCPIEDTLVITWPVLADPDEIYYENFYGDDIAVLEAELDRIATFCKASLDAGI